MHIARWFDEDREEDFDAPAGSDDGRDNIEEQLDSTGSEYSTGAEDNRYGRSGLLGNCL